ncbi:MAG: hypothetical protein HYT07_02460 [Candidatus Levybacteria bacterium]|nr:hypothetical protein [Candidatus Levybacteria bacterium]
MKKNNIHNLSSKLFAKIFNAKEDNLPLLAKQAIKKANFKYQIVEGKEYNEAILKIIKTLDSKNLKIAGPHRLADWENGWKENLAEFRRSRYNLSQLIPKFVKKGEYIRFQSDFIKPENDSFENDFVTVMRYYLFTKYYKKANTLYEFGAGTGLNLVAASEIFPKMKLIGLDWAESTADIINVLREKLNINISAKRFNLFKPDEEYHLDKDSGVLTIGTLEQLGKNFEPFINYLLKNKPMICINVETLYEIYDQENLLDYLAMKYSEQRNYLRGFLSYLKKLEAKKKIKIIDIRRTFGSFYHDGYTYLVWKPL